MLLAAPAGGEEESSYGVAFEARIVPTERAARVLLRIDDPEDLLEELRFRIDPERHRDFEASGPLETEGETVRWNPPPGTPTLRYVFRIDHLRDGRSYDARCAESWAIFRADDLVPPVRSRSSPGARSRSTLLVRVPEGWKVAAPYKRKENGSFLVDDPDRRFDRPKGWIAAGRLGILRETIAEVRVGVAGPMGHRLRRLDMLALLRWTLPSLQDLVGEVPARLLIVGAGDPMWRGGLSGPGSVFVHSSRPLITEDVTSPLLHELVHTFLPLKAGEGGDWIIEGLAELYAMEALVASKTVSRSRYERGLSRMAEKGKDASSLESPEAEGAVTALAVSVLHALDEEIRSRTEGERGLRDAVASLVASGTEATTASLRRASEEVAGAELESFFARRVGRRR
jgi:hypothetical protein